MMQLVLYCICGGIGVTTDYAVYYSALTFGLWYQSANVLGYISGTIGSFFLNRKITFGVHDRLASRRVMFLGAAAVCFMVSALVLCLMVDILTIDSKIAKLLTLPVVVAIQYFINNKLTFRQSIIDTSDVMENR